jgi:hypothetical protein
MGSKTLQNDDTIMALTLKNETAHKYRNIKNIFTKCYLGRFKQSNPTGRELPRKTALEILEVHPKYY